ncbi:MAG: glycoside hydrolase family 2 TIM barrel-domain containing protein [Bacteroidota bacterium]
MFENKIHYKVLLLLLWMSFVAFASLLPLDTAAQNPWQKPEVVNVNKLPARATSISFTSEQLALEMNRDQSPRKKSLNGMWKFRYFEAPGQVPANFHQRKQKNWQRLAVPANWELHGFGKPWQRLTHQIWEHKGVKQPNIPVDYNPTGCYRKELTLPENWDGMQITLHIGAASSVLSVWINGKYVGYSEDNRLPAEFDITPYLNGRKVIVSLQLSQWGDGSYLEDQDHWRMSGITREVYLEAAPKAQIYDFAVRTDLDEAYEDALLQIRPEIVNYGDQDISQWTLETSLFDKNQQMVLDSVVTIQVQKILKERHPVIGNRPFENLLNIPVKNPKKWSAEFPDLYSLVLALKDEKGRIVEARSSKVGFREIDISDGQFKVNGVPVLLYGVNRHDWDANTGKAVTKEAMRRDAELMKKLNVNASRSSHYPNPPYWYELCDEYGIYVMDEANIESHGTGSLLSNTPSWHNQFMERGIRMVERDKNYPSIVSWSLGNEAGFGPNHAAISAWIKEFDPTRPVHAEGAQNIYGYNWPKPEPKDRIYTDILSRMYRLTDDMIDLATQPGDSRPVIWCEYAHSQANSTGDLEGYWQAIRKYPRLVGGFIWDWRDQLVSKPSKDGKTLWKHGTDFGQKPEDLNPVQKGLISADGQIKSGGWQARHVWQRIKVMREEDGSFTVENRHFRTNLNEYDAKWTIEKEGVEVVSGKIDPIVLGPGKQKKLQLNLPEIAIEAGKRYYLKISFHLKEDQLWASKGYEVAADQFLFDYQTPLEGWGVYPPNSFEETEERVEISSGYTKVTFDKKSGFMTEYRVKDTKVFQRPLKPNFWRPATDNDLASGMPARLGQWKSLSDSLILKSFIYDEKSNQVTSFYSDEANSLQILMKYWLIGGEVRVSFQLIGKANLPNLPRVGMQVSVNQKLDQLKWFGRGPLETYADKKTGSFFGVYQQSVKADYTYYVRPQESSNKAEVWWAELLDDNGTGIRLEAEKETLSLSAWPFTAENIEKAQRIEDLKFSDITLNIDYKQMGVGGDNTWNRDAGPHKPFRIPAGNYEYIFTIKPIIR